MSCRAGEFESSIDSSIDQGRSMTAKRIGLIGFDGVVAIDLAGPAEAFACAEIREEKRKPERCYEVLTIAMSNRPFISESGLIFKPHKTFKNAPSFDTLII